MPSLRSRLVEGWLRITGAKAITNLIDWVYPLDAKHAKPPWKIKRHHVITEQIAPDATVDNIFAMVFPLYEKLLAEHVAAKLTVKPTRNVMSLPYLIACVPLSMNRNPPEPVESGLLRNLTKRYLFNTNVTDDALSGLAALSNFTTLTLGDTEVTEFGVKELQKPLPRCKVVK